MTLRLLLILLPVAVVCAWFGYFVGTRFTDQWMRRAFEAEKREQVWKRRFERGERQSVSLGRFDEKVNRG